MTAATQMALAADLSELTRLADRIEEFCAANEVPPAVAYQLTLAADELITNVISYGFPDGAPGLPISVSLSAGAPGRAEVSVVISDDGPAFDPFAEAPPPVLEGDIDDRPIGGLGVHLVRTMMDDVSYAREAGRNVVTLRKRITAAG